jgi:hypothetical protein
MSGKVVVAYVVLLRIHINALGSHLVAVLYSIERATEY